MSSRPKDLQGRLAALKAKYERGGALGEFAYAVLKDAILLNILSEGERLQERYLSEALGLSRTPVREALKRLEIEGLVEGLANGGVRIRELTLQDLEDIYELRIVLEGLAARLAAQRASSSDITCLNHLIEQSQTAVDAGEIGIPTFLNAQFHLAIADATRNKYLIELIARFHNSVQRLKYTTLSYPGRAQQALGEHRRLLEAIGRRDPEAAEQIAQEHVRNAKETQIKVYHERIARERLTIVAEQGGA